ncbi:hypothetical protein PEC301875_31600 [Pectobacterium carotovorum subsp. carotovorum]|nr:hypothetical protein PEC301875_31600 [Pectobacterium carotovorum subsp. carotovorum]
MTSEKNEEARVGKDAGFFCHCLASSFRFCPFAFTFFMFFLLDLAYCFSGILVDDEEKKTRSPGRC